MTTSSQRLEFNYFPNLEKGMKVVVTFETKRCLLDTKFNASVSIRLT